MYSGVGGVRWGWVGGGLDGGCVMFGWVRVLSLLTNLFFISMVSSTGMFVKSDSTSIEAMIPFGRRTRKICKKSSVELMMYLDGI